MGAAARSGGARLLILSAMAYLVLGPALQPAVLLNAARAVPWSATMGPRRTGRPWVTS